MGSWKEVASPTGREISGGCWVGEGMRWCTTDTMEAEEGASGYVTGEVEIREGM